MGQSIEPGLQKCSPLFEKFRIQRSISMKLAFDLYFSLWWIRIKQSAYTHHRMVKKLDDRGLDMKEENVFGIHMEEYDEWFIINQHLFDAEVEAIRQVLPAIGEGIEIGTGTGLFASRLGIRIGVEPSARMAAKAAARGIQIIDAYGEELPLQDNTYDYVLMVTVDCFLQDVLKSFQEIHRILKAEGCFILAFIDQATPLGRIYEANKATSQFYRDARFHTAEAIRELLQRAGFRVEETRQTIFTLENRPQEIRSGTGDGVLSVIKAKKIE